MAKYITRRRSQVKKYWGEEAAKAESFPTRVCPYCGNQAEAFEVQKDRVTYRCAECKTQNTYMKLPDNVRAPTQKSGNKLGIVTLRNRGRKEREEKPSEEVTVALREKESDSDKEEKPEKKDEEKKNEPVESIRNSMASKKVISFSYVDRHGKKSFRTVEPYKITKDKSGCIIVYGYCLESNGIRAFKLPRVANIQEQEYEFEPRWPIEDLL